MRISDWSSDVCSSDLRGGGKAVDARVARFAPGKCRRLVVKIGSALLVDDAGEVRRDWLRSVIADIAERRAAGQEIIIVSSGSIALGARRLGLAKGGDRKSTRLNSSH